MEQIKTYYKNEQLETFKNVMLSEPMDISVDILEVGLDQFFEEGFIKELPIIGSLVKVGKTIKTIQDGIFVKKILSFVYAIHSGSGNEEKWEKHKEKLENNPKKLIRELEVLLIYMDRHTKYTKSKILGNFYKVYYCGEIGWKDFEILAEILDSVSVFDLDVLQELYTKESYLKGEPYNSLAIQRLSNHGLVDYYGGMIVQPEKQKNTEFVARITKLGKIFVEMGLKNNDETKH